MRVSLFYNPNAGDGVSLSQVHETLEQHGHELVQVVERRADSGRLLEVPCDLVVVAGGDGTVSAAARLLAGRRIPLAILPLGTANNIARSLGTDGSIEQVIRSWSSARRQPLDVGVALGKWGESRFLEAVGTGLIPAGIAAMQADPVDESERSDSKVARAVWKYRDVLSHLKPRRSTLTLDGVPMTDHFLLVEVLNIRSLGPNLELSPDASPSDGFFSVVTAREEDREELTDYLQRRIEGSDCRLSLIPRRARRVDIQGLEDMHVDDEVISVTSDGQVSIRIEPAALEFLA
jgi:diacylglycerol kinase (ATP)